MSKVVMKIGDDISTDIIYPGRFMATILPTETPLFAFADNAAFSKRAKAGEFTPGSIIIAGKNFGCGSSREQAASCLRGYGFTVIARHFARIFLLNAINLGLNAIICPDIDAEEGDEIEIRDGKVFNKTSGKNFVIEALPQARQAIIDAGGLVAYTRQLLLKNNQKTDKL